MKFSHSLLKTGTLALSLNFTLAQAQTHQIPDYSHVNQASAQQVQQAMSEKEAARQNKLEQKSSAHAQARLRKQSKLDGTLSTLKNQLHWAKLPKTTIAPARELNEIELKQKKLIQCVDTLIRRHTGGYLQFQIAQDLLLIATDHNGWSEDADQINGAHERCQEALANIHAYKTKDLDPSKLKHALSELPVKNAAQDKSIKLIKTLVSKGAKKCEILRLKLEAVLIFGAGAEADFIRCLMENAEVRNFVGPALGIGFGAGLSASISVEETKSDRSHDFEASFSSGKVAAITMAFPADLIEVGAGVGSATIAFDNGFLGIPEYYHPVASMGAHVRIPTPTFGASLRVPNSPRHWNTLIDILK